MGAFGRLFYFHINNSMQVKDIEDYIKSLGYTEIKKAASNRLIVYMDNSERVSALQTIASDLGGKYTSSKSGVGWRSSVGAAILPLNIVVIAKPMTKSTTGNIASLDAREFTKLAKPGKFNFLGQDIDVVTFTNPNQIELSIVRGLATNRLLGPTYAEAFEDFFENGKIDWPRGTPLPIINKLGVYVSEVLIGWVFLSLSMKIAREHFTNNPFAGLPVAFHLPTDPAFSGVDSFVEMKNGSFYAISSKFGGGAKASFFTNLFEKGIDKRIKLSPSYFKDMCDFAGAKNISASKAKDFVYNYGVREILKISPNEVFNPTQVFDSIRLDNLTSEVDIVVSKIKELSRDPKIIDNLPQSISAYFNRTIADQLNKDKASVSQMKEILAGKDYWQANLDINSWVKGSVKFKFINSGQASLNIIGSKSAITDITSKQGWVNYELKY
jgi:hypothetical protein